MQVTGAPRSLASADVHGRRVPDIHAAVPELPELSDPFAELAIRQSARIERSADRTPLRFVGQPENGVCCASGGTGRSKGISDPQ
jgi:hypothetical protein